MQLKDAWVATDAGEASKATDGFLENLTKVDMSLVEGDAHEFWMQQLGGLKTHGEKLKSAKDVDAQRQQFDFLSELLIGTLQAFGTSGNEYFVQYCPMAIGDKGASWLSAEEEILNPYFGDKMLRCGLVKSMIGAE